jgi:hypothetical protein
MWYALQITIACSIAYYWTIMEGHSPANFGHGLFLGGLIAWYTTVVFFGLRDWYIKRKARSHLD